DLNRAEIAIKKQIDLLGKLTGIYSGIISELNSTIRLIDFISTELQASTIWYRPAYAITLEGIKNIASDITAFLTDVRIYISQFNSKVFLSHLYEKFTNPFEALKLFFKLFICLFFFYFLRYYEEKISSLFFIITKQRSSLTGSAYFIIGIILLFMRNHYKTMFIWILLWLLTSMTSDHYIYTVFYLFSIPYLFYLSNRFIRFLIIMNTEYNYILLPEDFQRRFEIVVSLLLYISIIIIFFRQAFILSSIYLRSELPNILLAINFIVL